MGAKEDIDNAMGLLKAIYESELPRCSVCGIKPACVLLEIDDKPICYDCLPEEGRAFIDEVNERIRQAIFKGITG